MVLVLRLKGSVALDVDVVGLGAFRMRQGRDPEGIVSLDDECELNDQRKFSFVSLLMTNVSMGNISLPVIYTSNC